MAHGDRLAGTRKPLLRRYDMVIFDLDGVLYVGADPLAGAAETVRAVRAAGGRVAFVTNNAARAPQTVARHLRSLGVAAEEREVVTAAQAAASVVAAQVSPGSRVLVVGGAGLRQALLDKHLVPVERADDDPAAVVQGFAPDVGWRLLTEGTVAVRRGLPWVASNTDETIPTARGPAPGNGLLVDIVARATGRRPQVAGKPEPALFEETLRRVGGTRPLVVGDRLDTDIAGAVRWGADSLLVLTGVSDVTALATAPPGQRPSYVSCDLGGLLEPHPRPRREGAAWCCGGWTVRADPADRLAVHGYGDLDDGVRALVSACWEWAARDGGSTKPPADVVAAAWRAILAAHRTSVYTEPSRSTSPPRSPAGYSVDSAPPTARGRREPW